MKIYLFDVDGVLIYPGGYRAALKATVDHYCTAMGLVQSGLDDATIETFEACGIISEWDSSAIMVAAIIADFWRHDHALMLPHDLKDALTAIAAKSYQLSAGRLDRWANLARRVGRERPRNGNASRTALDLLLKDAAMLCDTRMPERLVALTSVLSGLLENTYSFAHAPAMRVFQHFTLGSDAFSDHYGLEAAFETASLLRTHDRPALMPDDRDILLRLVAKGAVHPVIYTARPSHPRALQGKAIGAHAADFSFQDCAPEAELAASLVGLESIPLVGCGHVMWLSVQHGLRGDAYVKPSPVHALAAVGCALGAEPATALFAARALVEENLLAGPLAALAANDVEIHVFEDSAGGIRGVREAASYLQKAQIKATAHGWGIAINAEKRQALESMGVDIFENVGQALRAATG